MAFRHIVALVLVAVLAIGAIALAETDYIDLNDRFDNVLTYDYNGHTYYQKSRMTTMLAVAYNQEEASVEAGIIGDPELILLVIVDDNAKTVLPLQISATTVVDWMDAAGQEAGIPEGISLRDLFGMEADIEAGTIALMNALNGMFPADFIEDYLAFDLNGLTVIDGIANDGSNNVGDALMQRLHVIKATVEESAEATKLLSALSDYITSDMKSGALMKIADKVDRYDVATRMQLPALETAAEDESVHLDRSAFDEWMVASFFDAESMW